MDAVCHRFYPTCTTVTLPRNLLKVLQKSKYEDRYFVLRNMQITFFFRLWAYGMEMNVEKAKVMRTSR